MALDPRAAFDVVQGVLHVVLAAFLLRVSPTGRANRAFAVVLVVRGAWLVSAGSVVGVPDSARAEQLLRFSFDMILVLPLAILHLASVYPRPWRWLPSPWNGVLLATGAVAVLAARFATADDAAWQDVYLGVAGATFGLVAIVFLRFWMREPATTQGRAAFLMSLAFVLVRFYDSGVDTWATFSAPSTRTAADLFLLVDPAIFLGVVLLAGAAMISSTAEVRRGAATYLVTMGIAALTVVVDVVRSPAPAAGNAGFGAVWNLALPLLLAYAILRHQLLGIDVKVRWTLSKGTLAAAFVAVFFVASEAAQAFFGASADSEYLGIVAAGALVFALAPLQRAAERIAARAVPFADESPRREASEDAFRRAVRLAARAGLTAAEERDLVLLAHELGLVPARAFEIRDEVLAASRSV